jgi:hypothetical protein
MSKKELSQIIILLIGLLLVVFSFFIYRNINENNITVNTVLLSIGCSIISVVIINYFEYLITLPEKKTIININNWGLITIYDTRSKMNDDTNKLLSSAKELDIAVFGAKGLINYQGGVLKERLKKGMIMRILIPVKDSEFIKQREIDENVTNGEITKSINDLCNWLSSVKKELNLSEDSIIIKQYKSLPIESIMRIDKDIFVGPFMVKKISQLTMAYHYQQGGKGYDYYRKYFISIWNDNAISDFVSL